MCILWAGMGNSIISWCQVVITIVIATKQIPSEWVALVNSWICNVWTGSFSWSSAPEHRIFIFLRRHRKNFFLLLKMFGIEFSHRDITGVSLWKNHRIMEWFRLKGTLKDHLAPTPMPQVRTLFTKSGFSEFQWTWELKGKKNISP